MSDGTAITLRVDHYEPIIIGTAMTLKSVVKNSANRVLRFANARVESLTLERMEDQRLRRVVASGYFEKPVFPLPQCFEHIQCEALLNELAQCADRFCDFDKTATDDATFSFSNGYFTSPDAEILYAAIKHYRPATFLEVGSGNSTKMARQAILDTRCDTSIISIDPQPRAAIDDIVDTSIREQVEHLDPTWLSSQLRDGDILFIDSSHTLKPCSDVAFLFLRLLPALSAGILVHIHDIFFPYDYPREWIVEGRWPWNEQYLVQALLSFSDQFEVIWAGHFLQRTRADFDRLFPRANGRPASSLWLRKRSGALPALRHS
ncbi:MAG: class I SAM-dependent methyltransferase [Gemmatimonadaceae bacterium]